MKSKHRRSRRTIVAVLAGATIVSGCGSNPDAEKKSAGVEVDSPESTVGSAAPTTARVAPTTTVAAKLGDRRAPIPLGSEATFDNGWRVKVIGTTPDASAAVRAANQFNDPPPPGHQFYMVNISATYSGEGSDTPLGELDFSALDSSNTQIDEGECGVTPKEFDGFREVFSGGSLTGNICFVVPSATVSSLVLYVDAGLFDRQRAFFALQ